SRSGPAQAGTLSETSRKALANHPVNARAHWKSALGSRPDARPLSTRTEHPPFAWPGHRIRRQARHLAWRNLVGHALRNQAPPLALRNFDRRRRVSAHARGRVARRLAVEEGQRLRVDVAGRVQVPGVLKPSQRRRGSWPENAIDGARVIAEVVQLLLDVTH